MSSLIVVLATLYTDISPRLKWGKQNDAHELFLALVQSLLPTTNISYANDAHELFLALVQSLLPTTNISYDIIPSYVYVMRYYSTCTRCRQDAMKDLFVEITQKGLSLKHYFFLNSVVYKL